MTGFAAALKARLASDGPITVEAFMNAALSHYYATRDPLGRSGDFTTAPEISQIFGELVAVFFLQSWRDVGAPAPVQLVELGPGRGTLMNDIRRTLLKAGRDLAGAAQIHLVETSPALRAKQEALLGPEVHWHAGFDSVPRGPLLLVANEFFDALPIRQFDAAGVERCVVLDNENRLAFTTAAVTEDSPARSTLAGKIAGRIAREGGVALIIDYGHTVAAPGDTLQAVKGHRYADPLEEPGEADITAHVDFAGLAEAARQAGAQVHGPVTQGDFLNALGLLLRVEKLKAADPGVEAAARRLTDPEQMGSLFKVMAFSRIATKTLAGFP